MRQWQRLNIGRWPSKAYLFISLSVNDRRCSADRRATVKLTRTPWIEQVSKLLNDLRPQRNKHTYKSLVTINEGAVPRWHRPFLVKHERGGHLSTTMKRLLTVEEAAAYLGLSKLTVYDWISQRKIEYVKVGRLVKFDQRVLDTWIERHTIKPRGTHGTDKAA